MLVGGASRHVPPSTNSPTVGLLVEGGIWREAPPLLSLADELSIRQWVLLLK